MVVCGQEFAGGRSWADADCENVRAQNVTYEKLRIACSRMFGQGKTLGAVRKEESDPHLPVEAMPQFELRLERGNVSVSRGYPEFNG